MNTTNTNNDTTHNIDARTTYTRDDIDAQTIAHNARTRITFTITRCDDDDALSFMIDAIDTQRALYRVVEHDARDNVRNARIVDTYAIESCVTTFDDAWTRMRNEMNMCDVHAMIDDTSRDAFDATIDDIETRVSTRTRDNDDNDNACACARNDTQHTCTCTCHN